MEEIIHLDEKNRKILEELNKNSRQSNSKIGKKVGLSKQVVNYRIDNLLKNGVIKEFYTAINTGDFGIDSYYLFLQLENISGEKEKELLKRFNSLDYIGWMIDGVGRWDVILLVYAKSASEFYLRLKEITSFCQNNLNDYTFTTLVDAEHLGYKIIDYSKEKSFKHTEKKTQLKLDDFDKKLLSLISQNARISLVNLSVKLKSSVQVINYRLKKLIKDGVILGFKPRIDIHKIGYEWHLILIQFKNFDEKRKKSLFEFCKKHKNIYYVSNTIGQYNLMMDIHVRSVKEFRKIVFELKENFSDIIKTIELFNVFDEYKINYLPDNF